MVLSTYGAREVTGDLVTSGCNVHRIVPLVEIVIDYVKLCTVYARRHQ